MSEIVQWSQRDISFELKDELCEGNIATIEVKTPAGTLQIMGEARRSEGTLSGRGVHITTYGITRNEIGLVNLRLIATVVLERLSYDEIIVEGGVRTTGANPGHRPRTVRVTRFRRHRNG